MRVKSFLVNSSLLLPLGLGVILCFIVVGISPLNPIHFSMVSGLDPIQHYLGWAFFRFQPWAVPLGLNPNYGLEISSAIVYTDSIPIFAFLFKLISPILPNSFQYLGLWILTCFILQAYFGWKLATLMSTDLCIRLLITGLFALSPSMLSRIGAHAALVSHFLLLAAFLLIFQKPLGRMYALKWGLLLGLASLVHFYLLVMVFILWFFHLFDQYKSQRIQVLVLAKQSLIVIAIVGLAIWQAGYLALNPEFAVGNATYGFHAIDPLNIFNPRGWSYLLPSSSITSELDEGFIYLGLGLILLIPTALIAIFTNKVSLHYQRQMHRGVLVALVACILFALTNKINLPYLQWEFPLPEWFLDKANVLRMAPRLFWPVLYGLILVILYANVRGYPIYFSRLILGIAFCVQLLDTSAGWLPKRITLNQDPSPKPPGVVVYPPMIDSPLQDPFWLEAAKRYRNIRLSPLTSESVMNYYAALGTYAAKYHLGTDAVYLARRDERKVAQSNANFSQALKHQTLNSDSFYVLEDSMVIPVLLNMRSSDVIVRIDGFNVFAPLWKNCTDCLSPPKPITLDSFMPTVRIQETLYFNQQAFAKHYLYEGWDQAEKWGTWSIGNQSQFLLPLPKQSVSRIKLHFNVPVFKPGQRHEILIGPEGSPLQLFSLTQQESQVDVLLSPKDQTKGWVKLILQIPNPVRPADYQYNADQRYLGIGLISATFQ